MKELPNKIIQCPDCGVDCHYVAPSAAAMPFRYPGWYKPHQRNGRECMIEQIKQLRRQLLEKMNAFDSYQIAAMSTMFYPEEHRILFLTLGLAGEAGEVANQVKKIYRDDNGIVSTERREKIIKELGDVLWYMATLCVDLNITMGEIASQNINMLASRKERGTLSGDGDNR